MQVSASFKWNDKTKMKLNNASEIILRAIARQTLDYTGSSKVTAYNTGKTEQTMFSKGVQGNKEQGFYIGNFTDYASYVYPKTNVVWTNPNTKTRWFEHIWKKYGTGITNNAIKEFSR